MTNLMSISDVRQQLPNLVSKVNKYMDRVVITVKGQPKATLISAEELESLEETAEILSIPNIKRDLEKSRKQFKKGEFVYLSDLK
jgi:prevent-host-death family protein